MTIRDDAKIDLAYAQGMQQALVMAAQGAQEQARMIAEARASEARKVLGEPLVSVEPLRPIIEVWCEKCHQAHRLPAVDECWEYLVPFNSASSR